MLELNCSYQESKKVLELGYDFSKVCTFFGSGYPAYIKVNDDLYVQHCSELWGKMVYPGPYGGKLPEDEVPLIPKAALEACLPTIILDTEQGRIYYLSFDGHKTPNYRYKHKTPDGIRTTYTDYQSAFEAFLWLHENYPEELKAKFDEVMG
jgi:hypothetical protein